MSVLYFSGCIVNWQWDSECLAAIMPALGCNHSLWLVPGTWED